MSRPQGQYPRGSGSEAVRVSQGRRAGGEGEREVELEAGSLPLVPVRSSQETLGTARVPV